MFYTKANELNCFLPLFDIKIISSSIPDTHFHFQIKNFNCKIFKISRSNKKNHYSESFLEHFDFQLFEISALDIIPTLWTSPLNQLILNW